MDMRVSAFADVERTLEWAKDYFKFEDCDLIREYPWSMIFELTRGDDTAYLKMIPLRQPRVLQIQAAMSEAFAQDVPGTLAVNEALGAQILMHHGGVEPDSNPSEIQRAKLLETLSYDFARLL